MLFSLDGLLVKGEEETQLSAAEGQQLVALYRLFHRLQHSSQPVRDGGISRGAALQRVPFPAFLRPVRSRMGATAGSSAGVRANMDVNVPDRNEEARGDEREEGPSNGTSNADDDDTEPVAVLCGNTNRAANGMEEAHVRASLSSGSGANLSSGHGSGGAGAAVLQICTSQRELFCVQRVSPETNDAIFFCGAAVVQPPAS
ncbi:hypothetical protein C3747_146g38 [Trypanosoma cruzi]|uniref:Uncharacterized protein n=1 Tax=Trypanosoma cruzi TaxID=5693 RepID=A0A2V2W8N9_TRYCR|nr:hypothetical protein C3747_146g38 [Trypanosoma cruzi]RNC32983.1 hypothetical protein TcCL_Unassigned04360 [Trypanosoma cruzi]